MRYKRNIKLKIKNKLLRKIIKHTKRIHIVGVFFLVFALLILINLFKYTVLHVDFYKGLADKQQI
jgi:hypothetical protein